MKRQVLEPMNKGKKKKGLACQDQRTKESPVERTGPGSQRLPRARDPWDMQHSQGGIETAQKGNQKAQEMKDKYVLLKRLVM